MRSELGDGGMAQGLRGAITSPALPSQQLLGLRWLRDSQETTCVPTPCLEAQWLCQTGVDLMNYRNFICALKFGWGCGGGDVLLGFFG